MLSPSSKLFSDAAAPAEDEAPAAPVKAEPAYACITKAEIMSEPNTLEFGSVWVSEELLVVNNDSSEQSSSLKYTGLGRFVPRRSLTLPLTRSLCSRSLRVVPQDPLGLAEIGSDETLAWFRHAEVKHGRVAMAAFTGWAVVGAGLHLPGDLTRAGLHFADIPKAGLAAWDATPGIGKVRN